MFNTNVLSYRTHTAILLSTYNGENYIHQQLDSLIAQEYKDFTVFIRDDGSSDNTLEILIEYASRDPRFVILPSEGNLGVISSFMRLVELVEAEHYFFCDQDDLWLPEKIKVTLAEFDNKQSDIPILVHTDLVITDASLNVINSSFYAHTGTPIPNKDNAEMILLQNYIVGCTVAINRVLRDRLIEKGYDTKQMYMHDWWAALIATYYGEIVTLRQATIYYRQHGNNQCGARERNKLKLFIELLNNKIFQRFSANRNKIYTQVLYFKSVYNSNDYRTYSSKHIDQIIRFKQSHFIGRLWQLMSGQFPPSTPLRKVFDIFFIRRGQ